MAQSTPPSANQANSPTHPNLTIKNQLSAHKYDAQFQEHMQASQQVAQQQQQHHHHPQFLQQHPAQQHLQPPQHKPYPQQHQHQHQRQLSQMSQSVVPWYPDQSLVQAYAPLMDYCAPMHLPQPQLPVHGYYPSHSQNALPLQEPSLSHQMPQTGGGYFQDYPVAPANHSLVQSSARSHHMLSPGKKPEVTATRWDDEGTYCYQVEANGICVARRKDNDMINGTKLLNVAEMTRGRRDGVLKSEKNRYVVKVGAMHLKGVWIPFERALEHANRCHITDLLYPLFVEDIESFLYHPINYARTAAVLAAAQRRQSLHPTLPQQQNMPHQRPAIERSLSFPTPPSSASSILSLNGTADAAYWQVNLNHTSNQSSSVLALDQSSYVRGHSVPGTPAATPPEGILQNLHHLSYPVENALQVSDVHNDKINAQDSLSEQQKHRSDCSEDDNEEDDEVHNNQEIGEPRDAIESNQELLDQRLIINDNIVVKNDDELHLEQAEAFGFYEQPPQSALRISHYSPQHPLSPCSSRSNSIEDNRNVPKTPRPTRRSSYRNVNPMETPSFVAMARRIDTPVTTPTRSFQQPQHVSHQSAQHPHPLEHQEFFMTPHRAKQVHTSQDLGETPPNRSLYQLVASDHQSLSPTSLKFELPHPEIQNNDTEQSLLSHGIGLTFSDFVGLPNSVSMPNFDRIHPLEEDPDNDRPLLRDAYGSGQEFNCGDNGHALKRRRTLRETPSGAAAVLGASAFDKESKAPSPFIKRHSRSKSVRNRR